jgi:hypothetical protein
MKSQELDYDEILRRALRAAAESVEPAADGLDRIRGRVSARHLSPFMLLSQFLHDFFRPIVLLLESGGAGALSNLARLRAHVTRADVYGRSGPALDWARQRPHAAHRSQRPWAGPRARLEPVLTRLAPAASWLKPVLAVGGAVAVVVAGVFTLGQVQQAITPTNQFSHSSTKHPGATTRPSAPALVPPPQSAAPSYAPASSPTVQPTASCSPSAKPRASTSAPTSAAPTPTASITPTVTPTDSSSATPTPTSTDAYQNGVSAGPLAAVRAERLTGPCSTARSSAAASSAAVSSAAVSSAAVSSAAAS